MGYSFVADITGLSLFV